MNIEMVIYALVGLALLYLIIKLLKWPIKLLINGIIGIVLLYVANFIGEYLNFYITINNRSFGNQCCLCLSCVTIIIHIA